MRLLIATLSDRQARDMQERFETENEGWIARIARDGGEALELLGRESYDLMLLHVCLPVYDGQMVLSALRKRRLICPPRVLMIGAERDAVQPVDCCAPLCTADARLLALLKMLTKKPLPILAAANCAYVRKDIKIALDALGLKAELKGHDYAEWLLERLIPSPLMEEAPVKLLYEQCAIANGTTSGAVERCLRVAIENVFTQGSMQGIERIFGATVDPERGKPTNRAFLLQMTHQLRLFSDQRAFAEQQRYTP